MIDNNKIGKLYILHFQNNEKFYHYTGWTQNILNRINSHKLGIGCTASAACISLGADMSFTIYGEGSKIDEEKLRKSIPINLFSIYCNTCRTNKNLIELRNEVE